MPEFYESIVKNNREWVESNLAQDPNYFKKLADRQQPPLLWIGCADSRVPANQIIGAQPGDVFVHRNIANMVIHTDMNMLSVVDYAVNVLKIRHVIVCGHYGCGGIEAAMGNQSFGLIDNWIRHIKNIYRLHKNELDSIEDFVQRRDRFVELNVREQVFDLAKTSIVQNAWKNNQDLYLHGWAYRVSSGIIKDLNVNISSETQLEENYQLNF